MNILVTGGSGFIGSNLVADLLKNGHKVTLYDKKKSEVYPDLCVVGDVRDKEKLVRSTQGIDVIYHLAAEHRDDIKPVALYYEVNVGGANNIVYAMEKNGINRLIFTSTVAVYGLNSKKPDEKSPIRPFNDYGHSKFKSELVFEKWGNTVNTRCLVIVRPVVIFGEKNRGNVYNLLNQIASDGFIMVGKGENKKSMGYVLNLTHFLAILLKSGPGKQVYNFADKPDLRTNELLRITRAALGKRTKINFRLPYLIGLSGGYFFDLLAKIRKKTYPISSIRVKKFCADTVVNSEKMVDTGFVAFYTLEEGLKRMIKSEFLEKHHKDDFITGDEY
jgi:nucleoside-diphosphate-sugar epimerase